MVRRLFVVLGAFLVVTMGGFVVAFASDLMAGLREPRTSGPGRTTQAAAGPTVR